MKRRQFLIGGASATAAAAMTGMTAAQANTRPLPVIPATDLTAGIEGRIPLMLARGTHDFGNGTMSQTLGINRGYLGPLLRVKQGQTLPFDVTNQIGETSTIHWHGLHIPGDVDGGPHQEVEHGATWSPDVPITQHASMNWFHSHMHGRTAEQTYMGLAGVLLVEDDASLSADLPQTYGVDDFTLVLQDKAFDDSGALTYFVSDETLENGFEGEALVVNGAIAPVQQTVPSGLIRLRLLNACNSRTLTLSMADGPVSVIACEGGFLSALVETDVLQISPGERYEILVDMTASDTNALNVSFGEASFLSSIFGGDAEVALTLNRSGETGFTGSMPNRLANLIPVDRAMATRTRSFELGMEGNEQLAALAFNWGNFCGDGGVMTVNGQPMNMDRIDEEVERGDVEIWRIAAEDMFHPFHIHGCSFRILTQNGSEPPAYAAGWKDMVHVEEGWSEVLVRFDHLAPSDAPYMYHCHILEHEDCGMMGQFTVT
ncbi:MAG: multicopper oxidase domain-containing protein [Pseudomonadota bacterium]